MDAKKEELLILLRELQDEEMKIAKMMSVDGLSQYIDDRYLNFSE